MIAPHLEEMSKTMNDVVFLKVDVDDCEDVAAEYKVEQRNNNNEITTLFARSPPCRPSSTSRTSPKLPTSLEPMSRS